MQVFAGPVAFPDGAEALVGRDRIEGRIPGALEVIFAFFSGGGGDRLGLGPFVDALEERIALQLFLDHRGQFEVRQLKQLDRLQQLRRHHQGLSLADHQPCRKRHDAYLHTDRTEFGLKVAYIKLLQNEMPSLRQSLGRVVIWSPLR